MLPHLTSLFFWVVIQLFRSVISLEVACVPSHFLHNVTKINFEGINESIFYISKEINFSFQSIFSTFEESAIPGYFLLINSEYIFCILLQIIRFGLIAYAVVCKTIM